MNLGPNEDFQLQLTALEEDDIGVALRKTCIKLMEANQLLDCTLSCLDGQVQAHRVKPTLLRSTNLNTPTVIVRTCSVNFVHFSITFRLSSHQPAHI